MNSHAVKPDRARAIDDYRNLAEGYDASCRWIEPVRRRCVALLALQPGQTVLDVASGTGASLPALSQSVGPKGRVIAIEQSPEMVQRSIARCTQLGLNNVSHLAAPAESAMFETPADAALFHYTHDVLRSPAALEQVFAALRPGAVVVVAGYKSCRGWRRVFNPWFKARARGYLSTYEGLDAPWSHLLTHVSDFRIHEEYFSGSGYIATCRRADTGDGR